MQHQPRIRPITLAVALGLSLGAMSAQAGFPNPLPLSSLNGSTGFRLDGVAAGDNSGKSGSSYVVFGARPVFSINLQNSGAVTGLSGIQGSNTFFALDVPAGAYDCRGFIAGNNETCNNFAKTGRYWVMVNGYSGFSGVNLVGSYKPAGPEFDGDGRSDILWRHTSGKNVIWTMDGFTRTGNSLIPSAPVGWTGR